MDSSSSDVEYLFSVNQNMHSKASFTKPMSDDKPPKLNPLNIQLNNQNSKIQLYSLINMVNKCINPEIYHNALDVIKNHGIGGCRLFVSPFMIEICETLAVLLYERLSEKQKLRFSPYIQQYIPNLSKQILKTPYKQITQDGFLSSLFQGQESNILLESYNKDLLYLAAVYISNEELPSNFQFAPEMFTPSGWTPIEDFHIITSAPFFYDINNITSDQKLPFESMTNLFPSFQSWILKRIIIIVNEIVSIKPKFYKTFNEKEGNIEPKKIGSFEMFKRLNNHVIFPKRLSINIQKKLLRILYLYGIPKKNGFVKIRKILQHENINESLILVFVLKILNKAIKYKPNLINLMHSLTQVDQESIDDNRFVDINWIKDKAIEAVASNIELLYKIREYFFYFNNKNKIAFNKDELPEWIEIKNDCKWWKPGCDVVLYNLTAYYGFLFNSYFALYIDNNDISKEEICKWKAKESFELTPIVHPKAEYLKPILNYENRIKRLNQILDSVELQKLIEKI